MSVLTGVEGVNQFVFRRGHGAKRRVMHLAGYDRLGRFAGPLCGSELNLDTSCNLPLGRPICKQCLDVERKL
jgi:hypothetical protein